MAYEFAKMFSWLVKYLNHIKDIRPQFTHKIQGIEIREKTKKLMICFNVFGLAKPMFFKVSAKELMTDDNTLIHFSPLDSRLITLLAIKENELNPENLSMSNISYMIVSQTIKNSKTIFNILDKKTNTQFEKDAFEILYNPGMMGAFKFEDIINIAYTAGFEQIKKTAENAN